MSIINRRNFLKGLACACGATAATRMGGPMLGALADMPETEFFIFIMAAGGWDVTLWSDPYNEDSGDIQAGTEGALDLAVLPDKALWPVGKSNFDPVKVSGSNLTFGPGIGRLAQHYDRLTLINGVSMNTVSHFDGKAFSATGRHLAGGHPAASSIDTMIANELGTDRLLPNVSLLFPSSFVGHGLNPVASPLIVDQVGTIAKSLTRSALYDSVDERAAVKDALIAEANELATLADDPTLLRSFAQQYQSVSQMLNKTVADTFNATTLRANWAQYFPFDPSYGNYKKLKFQDASWTNACFAVQAMSLKGNPLVRCVSFTLNGYDTHNTNYSFQLQAQQEGFDVISGLVDMLKATDHPTLMNEKLIDHTHIMVISDFCRTPQINVAGGRDHFPNNSTLIISPRFKSNTVFSRSIPGKLLPDNVTGVFSDGDRPIGPPDILRTFVHAFGIDPAKYFRDGEVVPSLLT